MRIWDDGERFFIRSCQIYARDFSVMTVNKSCNGSFEVEGRVTTSLVLNPAKLNF